MNVWLKEREKNTRHNLIDQIIYMLEKSLILIISAGPDIGWPDLRWFDDQWNHNVVLYL